MIAKHPADARCIRLTPNWQMRISAAQNRHPRCSLSVGHPGRAFTDVNRREAENVVLST
jgi:hypothetical protein